MSIDELSVKLLGNGETNKKLGDLAANIALQNFDYRYATILFFNSTLYYGVELFLRMYSYNIIVNEGTINSLLAKVTHQYVMFGYDIDDFEQLLETFTELEMRNTGKFIIICQSQDLKECDEKELIKLFWGYKIVDMVLIKADKKESLGFTYYPISEGTCNNVKPIKLELLNRSQRFTTSLGEIYGMKFKKLSYCPLVVSTFIQSPFMNFTNGTPIGADGDLLRIIAHGLNTTLKIKTPFRGTGWGYRVKNGTWMGSLGDLQEDLANFSMTSCALTLTRFSDFQMSRSYYYTYVAWITHPAIMQNEGLKLLHPIEHSTRIVLAVSYLLVIVCAFVPRLSIWLHKCGKIQEYQSTKSVVFYSWMICMGQSITKMPTKSFLIHITFLWIYYCFIIRTVYQVYLISSLKGKFYEDQFESIDDAIKAKYPFGGGPALKDYYIDYPAVYDNWINVDASDVMPMLLSMSKGKKFVMAMSWDTAKVVIKEYKVNLHLLPQKIVSSPSVLLFKKYSPLAESINVVLSRLVTAGFPDKIHKDYTSIRTINDNNGEHDPLKLLHFTACYLVLVMGWTFSAVFFLLEVYFGRIYVHPLLSP